MIELFYTGVIIGILVSAPMGPIGMLCIQRTLSKGRWHGFVSGLGAALSDVLYAAFTGLFMGLVVNFVEAHQQPLRIFGSIMLGVFGYYIFRSNPVKQLKKNREHKMSFVQDFVSAFLLTFSNVLIVLLYIGLFARFAFVFSASVWDVPSGLGGIAVGAVLWWFFVTYIVSKLRRWFNIRGIRILNQIVGSVILVLAVVGIVYAFIE
ncbi:translocator protein, LysE family [Tannerella forsythia 92A2]|uniref:Translocator protein, LysE family n=1 Tax=Tannerella forsythia (strain ATCC 43037 / JCM 10827 / CCUG 21028 A / KCTC 5666 / FDC 338) TaxID=203275 RepID=G8UPY2_TANFA|nr:LysE family transporter [Tannerella forsythia]AEW19853.1 translocator protein, LysE family [Tannerella forsythia 92A2]